MKKFKFTLQTVHKVREMREEREKFVLNALRTEAMKAEAEVANLESKRSEAMENYDRKMRLGGQLNAMEMELNFKHFEALNRLQKEAEFVAEQRNLECRLQGEKVAYAMKEVKVTERLRDTQAERHQSEYERQEQNTTDELVSTGFARRLIQNR
jgi:flagellar export protein FliJ